MTVQAVMPKTGKALKTASITILISLLLIVTGGH
jgi:hypothetical protein